MSNEYVQVRTPDKLALADLLNVAKGPDRTMAQFAKLCGVSAPTLSRIANGKIERPIPLQTLKKIYSAIPEEERRFSFRSLVDANGMVDKERHDRMSERGGFFFRRQEQRDRESKMKNVIVTELIKRNVAFAKISQRLLSCPANNKYGLVRKSTFSLHLPEEKKSGIEFWNFYIIPELIEDSGDEDKDFRLTEREHSYVMERCASIFLFDAWAPELIGNERTSFVFADIGLFTLFVSNLTDVQFNTPMSAILIDPEAGTVKEEVLLICKNRKNDDAIFKRSVSDEEDLPDIWELEEIMRSEIY